MFQKFYPSEYYTSTYVIDFAEYYKKGYRGILFDIDNTLVPHNAPATEEAIRLIQKLKEIGFGICLVSNNKEPRVAEFNKPLDVSTFIKPESPNVPVTRKPCSFSAPILQILSLSEISCLQISGAQITPVSRHC